LNQADCHISALKTSLSQRAATRRAPTQCAPRVHSPKLRPQRIRRLFVRAEEEVVSRVWHELSLTHGADGSRNSSAAGVQTLDKGGISKEVTAGGPLLVSD